MKKVLLNLALALGVISANAQTPVGTVVNDFSLTDINGNTHTLFEYLDAGKMVVIDVSATWCGPCWSYHGTNALEDFYVQHGPAGADDAMVFFIEGDPTTTSADLNGTGANTQGNWVLGATHPIIDLTNTASFENSGMSIDYFPEMYVICPNRTILQSGVAGVIGTLGLLNSYIGQCPAPASEFVDPAFLSYSGTTTSCGDFELKLNLWNYGLVDLTTCVINVNGLNQPLSYTWNGNLGTYEHTEVNLGTVTLNASANVTFEIISQDGNPANSTLTQNLNFIDASGSAFIPYSQNFSNSTFPYFNWQNQNPDNDLGWVWQNNMLFMDTYNYTATGQLDDVITSPFNFANDTTYQLRFEYANQFYSANGQTIYDEMSVFVSTSCNGPWTQVWNKSGAAMPTLTGSANAYTSPAAGDFSLECVDLSAYAGNPSVYVKFTSINNYGNNIFIRSIGINNTACAELVNLGCTNSAACNYDIYATADNGSCILPSAEICDGIDNDCDGQLNEGLNSNYYLDSDNDGYGAGSPTLSCFPLNGYSTSNGDCDNNNNMITVGSAEVCDNLDNDCNGLTDDGISLNIFFNDSDNDGFGVSNNPVISCNSSLTGYVLINGDCDDSNSAINPTAIDLVDNGIDENCDGNFATGVIEIQEFAEVTLVAFPNPIKDFTNLNFNLTNSADVQMNIINMLGENVYTNDFGTLAAGNYNEVVNFNNMPAGLYLVNLNVNGKVSTLRLTVSK